MLNLSTLKQLCINGSVYGEIIINNYWHALWMECGSDHPSVFTLAAIAFTLPMSTAECERGFSRQNITKTRLRNRLLHPMLDALLRIDINAKKWSDINEQDVLKRWESRTSDNFFKQLDETDETILEHDLELIEDDRRNHLIGASLMHII